MADRVQAQIQFRDDSSAIDFVHEDGADEEGYLISLMASGLALLDFDNDRLIDVYLLSGAKLASGSDSLTPQVALDRSTTGGSKLFRNLGASRFVEVSIDSGAGFAAHALGAAAADFDNDGFKDLAISNFGSITLLKNNGDGTFADATQTCQLADSGIHFGAGLAFLDIENDGDLDLYAADYVMFDFERFAALAPTSFPYPPGPLHFEHREDRLFVNNGDGTFTDGSRAAGIAGVKSPSMGVVCGDFDNDDDTDIFVCSDARPNLMFINDGQGKFSQQAELLGVAYNAAGVPVGSMGAEAADVDNDGAEDLFITDYSGQMPILFRNTPEFGFQDVTRVSNAGRDVIPHANWGAGIADFDNDGDRDLLIGNGHLLKWANRIEQATSFKVRNTLLNNDGHGIFFNSTDSAGDGLQIVESSRGLAFDDLDNDGDIDCIANNSDAPASYLQNTSPQENNWIEIQLVGLAFNRDGVGAKVTVTSGDLVQVAEVRSGRGYQSHYGSRLHFGLGRRSRIDQVELRWLGKVSIIPALEVNRLHILREP